MLRETRASTVASSSWARQAPRSYSMRAEIRPASVQEAAASQSALPLEVE
ncbi:hypothetical protein KFK09_022153 [Dendrobium nobile]|uniref:Uncharacterized protein n=1 Tax=Dendrobium nobile TaxID=94219 RepID=A0A8T3AH15_DENNO|nr:hypothetical protein KFK09_022153 [Dendrobium nobile]